MYDCMYIVSCPMYIDRARTVEEMDLNAMNLFLHSTRICTSVILAAKIVDIELMRY
jgi:hypothetical protein